MSVRFPEKWRKAISIKKVLICFLLGVAAFCLIFFQCYQKVVREADAILFIEYQYGRPVYHYGFQVRDEKRCPLECVDSLRFGTVPGSYDRGVIYTLEGKPHTLFVYDPTMVARSNSPDRYRDPQEVFTAFIRRVQALALEEEGASFFYFPIAPNAAGQAFICFFMASMLCIFLHKI